MSLGTRRHISRECWSDALRKLGDGVQDLLAEVTALMYGDGIYAMGFYGDVREAQALAHSHCPGKPFCLVRAWRIIDVEVGQAYAQSLAEAALAPVIVYAEDVVIHSAGLRNKGDWVRTTFQRTFTQNFLFETQNTIYVLAGDGVRLSGSVKAVLAMSG